MGFNVVMVADSHKGRKVKNYMCQYYFFKWDYKWKTTLEVAEGWHCQIAMCQSNEWSYKTCGWEFNL